MIKDKLDLGCPTCGSIEKTNEYSLHNWSVEYSCCCKIWGTFSEDGIYRISKKCPNSK